MIVSAYHCLLAWVCASKRLVESMEQLQAVLRVAMLGLVGTSATDADANGTAATTSSTSHWVIDKGGPRVHHGPDGARLELAGSPSYRVHEVAALLLRRLATSGMALQPPSAALVQRELAVLQGGRAGAAAGVEPPVRCFGVGGHTLLTVMRLTDSESEREHQSEHGKEKNGSDSASKHRTVPSHAVVVRDDAGAYVWHLAACHRGSGERGAAKHTAKARSTSPSGLTPRVVLVPRSGMALADADGVDSADIDPLGFNARVARLCPDVAAGSEWAPNVEDIEGGTEYGANDSEVVSPPAHNMRNHALSRRRSLSGQAREHLVAELVEEQVRGRWEPMSSGERLRERESKGKRKGV